MKFNDLISQTSPDTFSEILSVAPRKIREPLFSHYGLKSKKQGLVKSFTAKREEKILGLKEKLSTAGNTKEQEVIKELIRNWLFHKRPMLKSALDFLGVENDNGLVEIETDFFSSIDKETVKKLIDHLLKSFPKDHIALYLYLMEVPHLDENLN